MPQPEATPFFSDKESGEIGKIRRGPVYSEFQVSHAFGKNNFYTAVRLYNGVPRVDFGTKILNREKFVRYRLLMPTSIKNGRDFQEIPFGAIERPTSQEFPAQNWSDYSDAQHGVTLLNRGLPGNNISGDTLILSLMRSTAIQTYGNFDQQSIESKAALELGKELTFHYALVPHDGDWRARPRAIGPDWNLTTRSSFIQASAHLGSFAASLGNARCLARQRRTKRSKNRSGRQHHHPELMKRTVKSTDRDC